MLKVFLRFNQWSKKLLWRFNETLSGFDFVVALYLFKLLTEAQSSEADLWSGTAFKDYSLYEFKSIL